MARTSLQKTETRTAVSKISEHRSYTDVSLVQRTLAILECANRLELITVGKISEECAIPPSSVIRILETLCAEGYLTHISRRGGYSLTSKVKSLSSGFHSKSLIMEVLQPIVDGLTKEYLWPFAVATLDHDAVVVQYSSIPLSPLASGKSTLHRRTSLISRAHGLAYTAFCSSSERKLLLKLALECELAEDRIIDSAYQWRKILRQTRERGYATRLSKADPFTNSVAVPIFIKPNSVIATMGVTYFRKVTKPSQISRMVASLKKKAEFAAEIVRQQM
jgi:IclR family mhp operon transcriptional activator